MESYLQFGETYLLHKGRGLRCLLTKWESNSYKRWKKESIISNLGLIYNQSGASTICGDDLNPLTMAHRCSIYQKASSQMHSLKWLVTILWELTLLNLILHIVRPVSRRTKHQAESHCERLHACSLSPSLARSLPNEYVQFETAPDSLRVSP